MCGINIESEGDEAVKEREGGREEVTRVE